ncbi:MAG: hypothetical protein QXT28_08950 [Thermofilaceae archaeon]
MSGLAERVRAAAMRVVRAEREKPGTYPEEVVEMAVKVLLTPVPQLRRELRMLEEQGRLSILDPLFEVRTSR